MIFNVDDACNYFGPSRRSVDVFKFKSLRVKRIRVRKILRFRLSFVSAAVLRDKISLTGGEVFRAFAHGFTVKILVPRNRSFALLRKINALVRPILTSLGNYVPFHEVFAESFRFRSSALVKIRITLEHTLKLLLSYDACAGVVVSAHIGASVEVIINRVNLISGYVRPVVIINESLSFAVDFGFVG